MVCSNMLAIAVAAFISTPARGQVNDLGADELVKRWCGTSPTITQLSGASSVLGYETVKTVSNCVEAEIKGKLKIKTITPVGNAAVQACIEEATSVPPEKLETMNGLIASLSDGSEADRLRDMGHARCYVNVLTCGQRQCERPVLQSKTQPSSSKPQLSTSKLRQSKILRDDVDASEGMEAALGSFTAGKVVKRDGNNGSSSCQEFCLRTGEACVLAYDTRYFTFSDCGSGTDAMPNGTWDRRPQLTCWCVSPP